MNNKKVSLVMVSALVMLIMAYGAAYAQDQKKLVVVEKEMQEKSIQSIAKDMGIDPTGLTIGQLKKAFAEKSIDIKSAASQQIEKKPLQPEHMKKPTTPEEIHNNLLSVAKEWGIDTTGMTDQQMEDILVAEKIKRVTKELGIHTTGLTKEQIKKAIAEKANDIKSAVSQQVEKKLLPPEQMKKPTTPEEMHNNLLSVAKEWGIDTTGMTDQQMEDILVAEKIKRSTKQ
jgi:protein-tyrosine-phosphatase